MCIYILYGGVAVMYLVFCIATVAITGESEIITPTAISSILISFAIFALNYKYFNKRKSLFVN